jgi:Leucine-zipper of ternary complex factor MIP1
VVRGALEKALGYDHASISLSNESSMPKVLSFIYNFLIFFIDYYAPVFFRKKILRFTTFYKFDPNLCISTF